MNPLKILLVDDSKSARYALRLQLQQHDMMVETADAAESALERIRQSPPDAIFMDHRMPGMSGFEALDILKTSPATAHIPVVICISYRNPELIAQAKKKGALDVLSKSTEPEALEKLLDRLQQAKATPADVAAAVGETAGEAAAALTDVAFEKRVSTLFKSLMDEREERLTADLIAKVERKPLWKLLVDMSYTVSERNLNGANRVVLDHFHLGESVESPDALKLPIGLALAIRSFHKELA